MTKIAQFRYSKEPRRVGTTEKSNQPTSLSKSQLTSGSVFEGYYPMLKLQINALSGTSFYLNNNPTPIMLGPSGQFEIDLTNHGGIDSLYFESSSIDTIANTEDTALIITIIYDN